MAQPPGDPLEAVESWAQRRFGRTAELSRELLLLLAVGAVLGDTKGQPSADVGHAAELEVPPRALSDEATEKAAVADIMGGAEQSGWHLSAGAFFAGMAASAGLEREGFADPLGFSAWMRAQLGDERWAEVVDEVRTRLEGPWERPFRDGMLESRLLTAALLEEAQEVAARVGGTGPWELRHLLAACFCPAENRQPAQVLRQVCCDRLAVDPREFLPELQSRAETLGDLPTAWRELVAEHLPGARRIAVARPHADIARGPGEDGSAEVLGITPEVEAFARVICLRDLQPPLSIGLFGDWGSGKTFFMHSLEGEIERLAGQERARRAAGDTGSSPFVGEVVHVWFNAWHYADANLWASLTAEFFEQLRAGGRRRQQQVLYQRLVEEVAKEVASARAVEAQTGRSVEELAREIAAKSGEIVALERELAKLPRELAAEKALSQLDRYLAGNAERVGEGLRVLGMPVAGGDGAELTVSLARLSEIVGREKRRLALLARALSAPADVSVPLLGAGLLVALVTLLEPWNLFGPLSGLGVFTGAVVTSLTAGGRLWSLLSPVLQAIEDFEADRAEREQRLQGRKAALEAERASLQEEQAQAQVRQAAAAGFAQRYAGGSPAALLHYFLHESAELRQYEEHLGLVSRVRRSFEKLDELVRRSRAAAARGEADPRLPPLERIVIYIDDLDRCRDEQVVHVLEAVHLLLAFELFVVVVGVDARWLGRSLAKHYRGQLGPAQGEGDGQGASASPTDYLEKIFQIPFWLRPLDTEADDGSYMRLIDSLVVTRPAEAGGGSGGGGGGGETEEPSDAVRGLAAELDLRIERLLAAGELPAEPPSLATATEMVTLTEPEVALLKRLGGLAGRSPRAVKRLVNIYRLVRQGYEGAALEAFLGELPEPPRYPALLFWLAADVGLSSREMAALREFLAQGAATGPAFTLHFLLDGQVAGPPPAELSGHLEVLKQVAVEVGDPLLEEVEDAAPEALRYSFRGRHLLKALV